jgi:hypothetical protein
MMNKKIAYLISSAALLGSGVLFPAFAADVHVTGNGAFSDNNVRVSNSNSSSFSQSNDTSISNNVRTNNNTGNNNASFNTGGRVVISTGDANSNVTIKNSAGSNVANIGGWDSMCGCERNTNVKVSGNGAFSDNNVHVSDVNKKYVSQKNDTHFYNNVYTHNNAGYNNASFNTGSHNYKYSMNYDKHSGMNAIYTGNANANAYLENSAGYNALW